MSAPRFVALTPELLAWALAEERDRFTAEMMGAEEIRAAIFAQSTAAYALLGRGRVLAAGGMIARWAGCAAAWMLISREAGARDILHATRRAREEIDAVLAAGVFHRVEMTMLADALVHCGGAFVVRLGMATEALMRCYDPLGRDHFLFARVRGA